LLGSDSMVKNLLKELEEEHVIAEVAGKLILVDHALFRIDRGAVGLIAVEGSPNSDIFSSIKNTTLLGGSDVHSANI